MLADYPFPDCLPIPGGLHYGGHEYNGLKGKAEQVLHYCCHRRAMDTAELVQHVWPDTEPAIGTVQNAISKANAWCRWNALPLRIERAEYPVAARVDGLHAAYLAAFEVRERVNLIEHCPSSVISMSKITV